MSRSLIDILAATGLFIVGIIVWQQGASIPPSFLDSGFGSGFVPTLIGGSISFLAAILLVQSLKSKEKAHVSIVKSDWAKPVALAVLLALFVGNMDVNLLPFYPAASLFVFFSTVLLGGPGKVNLIVAALLAVVGVSLIWALFTQAFLVIIR